MAVSEDVQEAFNLDTAIGEQLDFIGAVIDLPRSGFDDTRYRTFLQIQTDILLGQTDGDWTGTINNILTMSRKFIGTGVIPPIVYTSALPYAFLLTVPGGLSVLETQILFRFICKAIYAGVLGQTIFVPAGDNVFDSVNVVIANSMIFCSVNVVIANCGEFSTVLSTDTCF